MYKTITKQLRMDTVSADRLKEVSGCVHETESEVLRHLVDYAFDMVCALRDDGEAMKVSAKSESWFLDRLSAGAGE